MFISHTESASAGFKKWSITHPNVSDDRRSATDPVVVTDPVTAKPNVLPLVNGSVKA